MSSDNISFLLFFVAITAIGFVWIFWDSISASFKIHNTKPRVPHVPQKIDLVLDNYFNYIFSIKQIQVRQEWNSITGYPRLYCPDGTILKCGSFESPEDLDSALWINLLKIVAREKHITPPDSVWKKLYEVQRYFQDLKATVFLNKQQRS